MDKSSCPRLLTAIMVMAFLFAVQRPAHCSRFFRDDFDGVLQSGWTMVREDTNFYSIGQTSLSLRCSNTDLYLNSNNAKNLFIIDAPVIGDFVATLCVQGFEPYENQSQIGLLAYDDDDNHVRSDYGHIDGERVLEFATEEGGYFSCWREPRNFSPEPFYLRLVKTGNVYAQYYSSDGVSFTQSNGFARYGDGTPAWVGFWAANDPTESAVALLEWFEVTWNPTITGARLGTDGAEVDIDGAIVSADFVDFFYIESDDRVSGLRVDKVAHLLEAGMRAHVVGALHTNGQGEGFIQASDVHQCNPPNNSGTVTPLAMQVKAVGGAAIAYKVGPPVRGQLGVAGAFGLNNIGLLVKVWGEFTKTSDTTFTINDGSPSDVKCVVPDTVTLDPLWKYVIVTGVVSCEKDGNGDIRPLIRVQERADIQPLP